MTSVGTDLLSELKADRAAPSGCTVCAWLSTRDESERAEWAQAFADKSISVAALHRAMKKRGYTLTDAPVVTHRSNHLA